VTATLRGAPWLAAPETRAVTDLLEGAGHQALFVGGCVRNALLGAPVSDVDVATEARPDRVLALAARAGLRAVPTGIAHGTVTLVVEGRPFEVTTFRRDVATDGRRAVVAFSDDVAEDAARRDFTMNALYARPDGAVLDPTGEGLADLGARRVRFVGDPARRIAEDYLRILRFFRFHAWYGDRRRGPDPEALAACEAGRAGLAGLSRERVGAEMTRLLVAPDPAPALVAMAESGILAAVLPGADPGRLARLLAAEAEAGAAPLWERRLAALAPDADWPERLRASRAARRRVAAMTEAAASGETPAALAYRHGRDVALDAVLLRAARGTPLPGDLAAALAEGAAARFPLRARDLDWLAGRDLGEALRRLERVWLDSGFRLDREALLRLARQGRT
jgi:poly(A) polymerase